jgi:hypothetical protein
LRRPADESEDAMPFKSKAQRRKFAEMLVKGEISPETFEEWNRETGSAELPERVTSKPGKKRSRARAAIRRKKPAARPAKRASKRKSSRKTARKRTKK